MRVSLCENEWPISVLVFCWLTVVTEVNLTAVREEQHQHTRDLLCMREGGNKVKLVTKRIVHNVF